MGTTKRRVSDIERGAGYFQGFATNLMDVVREKGVPFEAIYRLATQENRATIEKMVEMAHEDWLAEQPKPALQIATPYRGGIPSGESRDFITVPDLPAPELIELVKKKHNLTGLDPDYAKYDFLYYERGMTFEVKMWKPDREVVPAAEVREHFTDGFVGNTAAFLALVAKNDLEGYHASIPEDDRLFRPGDYPRAPHFVRDVSYRELRLSGVAPGRWHCYMCFWAFRKVS